MKICCKGKYRRRVFVENCLSHGDRSFTARNTNDLIIWLAFKLVSPKSGTTPLKPELDYIWEMSNELKNRIMQVLKLCSIMAYSRVGHGSIGSKIGQVTVTMKFI